MQKGNEFSQTTTWIRLLANQENQPRLVGILQSSLSLARQLMASCQLNELVSFYKASDVNRQLMADTIAASGCDGSRGIPAGLMFHWYRLHSVMPSICQLVLCMSSVR